MKSDETINDEGFSKESAKALGEGGRKRKVSRMWVIRQLCLKKFKSKRPTAVQIKAVIDEHGLNRYTADGKKRSKEVITEAMQKAVASLR
tara:strand:- start:231 stop:500 length:270 start_codon:yes stop_codon:yes gene_type:complete